MKIEKMSTEQGGKNYKKIEQLIFLLFCFIQTTKRTQFSREGHFSLLPHISTNLIKEPICIWQKQAGQACWLHSSAAISIWAGPKPGMIWARLSKWWTIDLLTKLKLYLQSFSFNQHIPQKICSSRENRVTIGHCSRLWRWHIWFSSY